MLFQENTSIFYFLLCVRLIVLQIITIALIMGLCERSQTHRHTHSNTCNNPLIDKRVHAAFVQVM